MGNEEYLKTGYIQITSRKGETEIICYRITKSGFMDTSRGGLSDFDIRFRVFEPHEEGYKKIHEMFEIDEEEKTIKNKRANTLEKIREQR